MMLLIIVVVLFVVVIIVVVVVVFSTSSIISSSISSSSSSSNSSSPAKGASHSIQCFFFAGTSLFLCWTGATKGFFLTRLLVARGQHSRL